MRAKKLFISTRSFIILLFTFLTGSQLELKAQTDSSITVYQYRKIPENKIDEFIKRETTYWSKVAESAVKNKTMTFWGIFAKVGGYDMSNSPNFLFINTFPNIDKVGEFLEPRKKLPVCQWQK